ncbi:MAG: ATP synthase F1 subunit epsilon [Candidatus Omnitrophica bacterium]|nr:ATP synthase F1 subunit epsilon [Candidatus Omnitrophota bacterium]MDE2009715.1 ATP synthase F1 subunit epsilon [Candidatus Omnitrophota bacterium]MDE2213888.1 ATP synthase F1 subunit epsilon [Candidatus Omnitrophota bacterium]MDE2231853.1 ATP synthase F1 subunit epsilon [Candidatus Omnitrophota bacterium]
MSFKLSIVAPSGKIFENTVDSVALPGAEGAFEVYSMHTPLISTLKAGRARVRRGDKETAYEITSGILEVDLEHNVTLLADQATPVQ